MTSRTSLFSITDWQVSGNTLSCHYTCARYGAFTETVTFPLADATLEQRMTPAIAGLIDLLHAAMGVSYYKAAAATKISFSKFITHPAAKDLLTHLYTDGMAEFFVRNNLGWPIETEFTFASGAPFTSTSAPIKTKNTAIIAFGGGKDSYVARAITQQAQIPYRLASVVLSSKVADTLSALAPEPVAFVWRKLDTKLGSLNKQGALNGHVPITAINSLALAILASLEGDAHVIFANERSADEPTIDFNGVKANHQYSKSSEFEHLLDQAIKETGKATNSTVPEYFSILRPYSELWIAQSLAKIQPAHSRFSSCNRNFHIDGSRTSRWCGDCAKCAFTTLMLSPFLSLESLLTIFPENFLNKQSLSQIYAEILGLTDQKPWDCVGTIMECRAAVWKLSESQLGRDTFVVQNFLPQILQQNSVQELETHWHESLKADPRFTLPSPFQEAALGL